MSVNTVINDTKPKMEAVIEDFKRKLSNVRTGRATVGLLDTVMVDYYGTPTPLNQMASVAVPEPQMLTIQPWDISQVNAVEKAIIGANLSNDDIRFDFFGRFDPARKNGPCARMTHQSAGLAKFCKGCCARSELNDPIFDTARVERRYRAIERRGRRRALHAETYDAIKHDVIDRAADEQCAVFDGVMFEPEFIADFAWRGVNQIAIGVSFDLLVQFGGFAGRKRHAARP